MKEATSNRDRLYAVIMAGGRGTRFWPLSRNKRPKQLLSLTDSKPLLRQTADRISALIDRERVLVVTGDSHAEGVMGALPDIPKENILIEPEGKNTAPALAFAAANLLERDKDAVMVVMPSDHIIGTPEKLLADIELAARVADENRILVTFGIRPTRPETGYGYIEVGGKLDRRIFKVLSFKEKPNRKKAKDYVDSGHYLWNSGMFVFRCDVLMEKLEHFMPEMHSLWKTFMESSKAQKDLEEFYAAVEPVSIDYGVMEKCPETAVINSSFKWSDIGMWKAIDEVWEPDDDDNRSNQCTLISVKSQGNTVLSRKLVALLGVDDLIVVETDDALLVAKKDHSQEIKEIVKEIEKRGLEEYL